MKIKIAIALALTIATTQAQNLTGYLNTGITNITAGATAGAGSNALSTALIEVRNHEQVSVQWIWTYSQTNLNTGAGVSYATFGGSMVPSNLVPIISISNTAAITTNGLLGATGLAQNAGANINLGGYRYFGLIGMYNGATNSVVLNVKSPTNQAGFIGYQFKDNRLER